MSTTTERRPTGELTTRSIDAKTRSADGILATENAVHVWDAATYRAVLEILLIGGCEAPDSVPFLTDHERYVPSAIGSVRDIRAANHQLLGRLYLSSGSEPTEHAWGLIRDGHLRGLSVGYKILEFVTIPRGQSKSVGGRMFSAPADEDLRVVTRWRLREVSLVPLAADEAAMIRSKPIFATLSRRNEQMTSTTSILGRDLAAMRLTDLSRAILQRRDPYLQHSPESDDDRFRAAFSTVEGLDELSGVVNSAILGGFRDAPDSTAGWVRSVPLPNYLRSQIAVPNSAPRLEQVPRGRVAPTIHFSLTTGGWRLARFGAQFVIDEQDAMEGTTVGVLQTALEELGRAARRLVPDLVYSLILSNPALDDDVALFDAGRSNLGTDALADTALDTAIAAVGNQVTADRDGRPVHLGLSPKYLIVPPDLSGSARRLVRDMDAGDGQGLTVRAESRMGAAGVVNPLTQETATGSTANWLLACPSDQTAGVVVGFYDGRPEPSIRSFTLDGGGQFGVGFDIQFAVAAMALTGKPLYFSSGEGE